MNTFKKKTMKVLLMLFVVVVFFLNGENPTGLIVSLYIVLLFI